MLQFRKYWPLAVMFGTVGAAIFILCRFDPAADAIFPPCPVHYLTGWYCPGCGSLRALHQLLHGNFRAAWAMNPLTIVLLPFLSYGVASRALVEIRGRGLPQVFVRAVWIRALCAVIILFGILRNVPAHPFDLLAPGAMR